MSIIDEEEAVIWLHDPNLFPFVREGFTLQYGRSRAISLRSDKEKVLIGFTTLKRNATSLGQGRFYRRFFYLSSWDYKKKAVHYLPVESVDTLTVAAGVAGHKTERSKTPPTLEQRRVLESIFDAKK